MSKNNYRNYHNYSSANTKTEEPVVEKEVEVVADVEEVIEEVETAIADVEEVIATDDETPPVIGVISGCNRLRVRAEASTDAEVICEIPVNTKVVIDEVVSTDDFCKICTESGIEGFCMRKFITIE